MPTDATRAAESEPSPARQRTMIVGHSMLAFAAVAGGGAALGWSPGRALRAGAAAAAFAVVPDVDMVYGTVAVAVVRGGNLLVALDAFWMEMARIHRLGTHFLLTGAVAALGVAAVGVGAGRRRDRRSAATGAAGVAVLVALVAWTLVRFAPLDAVVVAVYALAGVAVAVVAVRRVDLDGWAVLAAAAGGLVSHPFGDVFAGEPPSLFYPLVPDVPGAPLQPFADPTLSFLLVFGLELATVWCAVAVLRRLTGLPARRHLDARALLGVPYAVAAFVGPVPLPDVWYYPTFSVLATGGLWLLVGGVGLSVRRSLAWRRPARSPVRRDGGDGRRYRSWTTLRYGTTALAAVTLAAVTYAASYVVAG